MGPQRGVQHVQLHLDHSKPSPEDEERSSCSYVWKRILTVQKGEKKRDNISDRLEFSTVASEREACPPLISYFTTLTTATLITDSASFFFGGGGELRLG